MGHSRKRGLAAGITLACAACASLALGASPALAHFTHLYDAATTSAFGNNPGALGVAIDQSEGDVYVAELNGSTIRKYTAAGALVSSFGTNGHVATSGYAPWGLAVDQSSHDLYVTSEFSATIHKLDASGKPVTSFGENGVLNGPRAIGVAVDPLNGNLYLANFNAGEVEIFSSSGSPIGEFSSDQVTRPWGIAIDSSGRVYLDGGGYEGGGNALERFSESGTPEGVEQTGAFQGIGIDPTTQDVYATEVGEVAEYGPGAETQIARFGSGVVNDAWGVAVNGSTEDLYVGTYYGSSVDVFGPAVVLADVTTEPAAPADIHHQAATVHGEVDPAGPPVTECRVEYGPTTEYAGGSVPCKESTPITTPTEVSADLTGLTPLVTYHYRVVAKNENGVSDGQDQTFEPPAVFGLATGGVSGVEPYEATLGGEFQVDPEGGETHYRFEYGPTESYGQETPVASESTEGQDQVSAKLTGLDFYSTYHYRLVATNQLGTDYGADRSFQTTAPQPPVVDSTSASGVAPEAATLGTEVNPGFGATIVRFQYGTTTSYGSTTPPSESIGNDASDHPASASISELQPGTEYHFRAVAVNFSGVTAGPDATFDTPDRPTVADVVAQGISQTGATLVAQIIPGFSSTTYHFEYGTSALYGQRTPESGTVGSDDAQHPGGATLSGLAPGTTYHYRVVATNAIGSAASSDATFTTAPLPENRPNPPVECGKGKVLKHGRCIKAKKPHHRKRHHRKHRRSTS